MSVIVAPVEIDIYIGPERTEDFANRLDLDAPRMRHGASQMLRRRAGIKGYHLQPGPHRWAGARRGTSGALSRDIRPLPKETPTELVDRIQRVYPSLTNEQCVELARKVAGISEGVWDWRRGESVSRDLPPGTPIATFMSRSGAQSEFYDAHQGYGAPGNNTTHAAVLAGYTKEGILVEEQYVGSGGPHLHEYKFGDPRGGEKAAENYFSINDPSGLPAGSMNPLRQRYLENAAAAAAKTYEP